MELGAPTDIVNAIRYGVTVPWASGRPPRFNQGISLADATPAQRAWLDDEIERLVAKGAWEPGTCGDFVSRCFLVPKPGDNKWRLVVDLRHLNQFVKKGSMQMETLKDLRRLVRKGDYMFSFDLEDGFYALGVQQPYRKYFTVNIDGTLYQFAGLPMGYTLSPRLFCRLTETMIRYLRTPAARRPGACVPQITRRNHKKHRAAGARMLPFVDDFLFMAPTRAQALDLRREVEDLWTSLGLSRNATKGVYEPTQCLQHFGLPIDSARCDFRAPADKLAHIADLSRSFLAMAHRRR